VDGKAATTLLFTGKRQSLLNRFPFPKSGATAELTALGIDMGGAEKESSVVTEIAKQLLEESLKDAVEKIVQDIEKRIPTLWPKWMTLKTAAKYIDHSERSLEYLMSKDLFPVVRKDRLVLLDRDDIDAVLTKLKQ